MSRQHGDLVDLRCLRKKHLEVEAGASGVARVHCRECRTYASEVVIHYLDLATGELLDTRRYTSLEDLWTMKRRERVSEGD